MARAGSSFWRKLLKIVIVLVVLALAFSGFSVYRALTDRPTIAHDYHAAIEDMVASRQPVEGENGWPLMIAMLEHLGDLQATLEQRAVGAEEEGRLPNDWPADQVDFWAFIDPDAPEAVRELARESMKDAREQGLFEQSARVAQAPRFVRPMDQGGPVINMLLPNLGSARNMARFQVARARIALEEGDPAQFVVAMEETLALGRALSHQATLIDHLVGIAIHALVLGEIRRQMMTGALDAEEIAGLLEAIDRQPLGPLGIAIEGERMNVLDVIQRTYTDDGNGGGRFLPAEFAALSASMGAATGASLGGLASSPIANVAGTLFPSRRQMTETVDTFYFGIIDLSELPHHRREDAPFDPGAFVDWRDWRYVLLQTMVPAFNRTLQSQSQIQLSRAGTRLMLAIELHRARHGALPESLQELVPGELAEIPADPYSPDGLVYRRVEPEDDEHGRDYLLYSVGADRTDDGGTDGGGLHVAANPVNGIGFDAVINEPEER